MKRNWPYRTVVKNFVHDVVSTSCLRMDFLYATRMYIRCTVLVCTDMSVDGNKKQRDVKSELGLQSAVKEDLSF